MDLADHREIAGNFVTPSANFERSKAAFETALNLNGVFCLATHYWELSVPSLYPADPTVGEQMRYIVDRARSASQVKWRSVGDTIANGPTI